MVKVEKSSPGGKESPEPETSPNTGPTNKKGNRLWLTGSYFIDHGITVVVIRNDFTQEQSWSEFSYDSPPLRERNVHCMDSAPKETHFTSLDNTAAIFLLLKE